MSDNTKIFPLYTYGVKAPTYKEKIKVKVKKKPKDIFVDGVLYQAVVKENNVTVTARIPKDYKMRIDAICRETGLTQTDIIKDALAESLYSDERYNNVTET